MGKKALIIMVVAMIAVAAFIEVVLPKMAEDGMAKASIPKLDVKYVKVLRQTGPASQDAVSYSEVGLSDSDKQLVMDYINFGGRDWTQTEDGYFDGTYQVAVNDDQRFQINAATDKEIKLTVLYVCSTADGVKMYKTEISGNAAAPLLVLLQGGGR